ncbi:MAG TPA: hypothetical protein VGH53_16320 [Streptosporangiaceae bacterium]
MRTITLARAGVPAPGVIAARADDAVAVLLIEYVDGSSGQPAEPDPAGLAALGRMAARISMVKPAEAESDLACRRPNIPLAELTGGAPRRLGQNFAS